MEGAERKNQTEKEESAKKLLRAGDSAEKVAFCLNMSIDRVKELAKTLQ